MRSLLIVLVALLACYVSAGLISQRSVVPKDWAMMSVASPSSPVAFTLGLRTKNNDKLDAHLEAVSDPSSLQYMEYLTTAEINEMYGATEEDVSAVSQWLSLNGASQIKPVHGAIRVVTTAQVASRLFSTEMRLFKHKVSGKEVVKAWGKYSLPDQIHERVTIVTGLSSFPIPGKNPFKRPTLTAAPTPAEAVLPQTIQLMYRVRQQQPGSHPEATQGVIEYENQFFSNTDTATFQTLIGYNLGNETIAPVTSNHIVGRNVPASPQVESSLDIQWISAINLEATSWFWIEDGTGWLYEFGTHMLNFTTPPQVTSTSYGWWEGDQCDIDGTECQILGVDSYGYAAAVNGLFQKVGLAGVSLLVASGDSGANSRTDEGCTAPNLRPEFPAASPFVTTVGATEVRNATYGIYGNPAICAAAYSCINGGREVAVSRAFSQFTSGGGFSNVTGATRPSWQNAAVNAYFNSGVTLPPASMWNREGRGEPDVAAIGHNGIIVVGGSHGLVGGTSMSSPIFAGVISFLNTITIAKTGKPLGFLNPFLYQMHAACPTCFTDIVVGDNICPEEFCGPGCKGYVTAKGWDPVTGLGTPRADNMEAYVSKLMDEVIARKAEAKKARQHLA